MRKHIAKAIQSRSKSLRNALVVYNAAAETLGDRPPLTWAEILEMGRLEDFDLLRLAREDIREAAWAKPGARPALDLHYQVLRAKEEVVRLNVEITRWVTWMKEERNFLKYHERRLEEVGKPARALQVLKYRMLQGRFYDVHYDRLAKISHLPGFTGSIEPGVGVCGIRRGVPVHAEMRPTTEERVQANEGAVAAPARVVAPDERACLDVEKALEECAKNEESKEGDDGGAKDFEEGPPVDEADTDAGFEVVLLVAEDRSGPEDGSGGDEEGPQ